MGAVAAQGHFAAAAADESCQLVENSRDTFPVQDKALPLGGRSRRVARCASRKQLRRGALLACAGAALTAAFAGLSSARTEAAPVRAASSGSAIVRKFIAGADIAVTAYSSLLQDDVSWMGAIENAQGMCLHADPWDGSTGRTHMGMCLNASAQEEWKYDKALKSISHKRGKCLDGNEPALRMLVCNSSSPGQQWTYDQVSALLYNARKACLQASAPSEQGGAAMMQEPCGVAPDPRQQWQVGVVAGKIKSRHGLCLSYKQGYRVRMSACEFHPHQSWEFLSLSGLVKHELSGLCLDGGDPALSMQACNEVSNSQRWTYTAEIGVLSTRDGSRCLDTPEPTTNGGDVRTWTCYEQDPIQQWTLGVVEHPVHTLSYETRSKEHNMPMPGVPGRSFYNLGVGQPWDGFGSKVDGYIAWLTEQQKTSPQEIVILLDGGDIAFGGCSNEELLSRYHKVVKASNGAQVVAGAETEIYPEALKNAARYQALEERRRNVLSAFDTDAGAYTVAVTPEAHQRHVSEHPWSENIEYAYLNSGFLMGPVSALLGVLQCVRNIAPGWWDAPWGSTYDDQLALTECMLHDPSMITIDYSGTIVFSTWGINQDTLQVTEAGNVRNKVLGRDQCFLHFNGQCFGGLQQGCDPWNWLLDAVKPSTSTTTSTNTRTHTTTSSTTTATATTTTVSTTTAATSAGSTSKTATISGEV
mmetsp:Transcript_27213/g.71850  ORF Transcript_27213/g.71850 Transcript_27213/m.71850 type:complete len:699 (+) Transcript_27213:93-2189(+)